MSTTTMTTITTTTTPAAAAAVAVVQTEGIAEPQYKEAKTSVWWDIENCPVPQDCDPHAIAQNIASALNKLQYCGPLAVSAYGDTNRIPMSVQHALSSTGITLNHVPSGVKDASDKKILVDMLFWAVDNPAPANYLLISGDRDFSNALHQLRMRRYNILLGQPQNASAPLLAAAKSVWRWTILLAGGFPMTNGELLQFASLNNVTNGTNMLKHLSFESRQQLNPSSATPPPPASDDSLSFGNQKVGNMLKHLSFESRQQPNSSSVTTTPASDDSLSLGNQKVVATNGNGKVYKVKQVWRATQPKISRSSSDSDLINDAQSNNGNSSQPGSACSSEQFIGAPHEFFGAKKSSGASSSTESSIQNSVPGSPDHHSLNNGNSLPSNYEHHYSQPLKRSNGLPMQPNNSAANLPGNSKVNVSEYPSSDSRSPPRSHQQIGESNSNSNSNFIRHPVNLHSNPRFLHETRYSNRYPTCGGVWGTPGCPEPPGYVQGLIGVILLALDTLKNEKMTPTEANITDCIRYGEYKNHRDINVKMALESAIEQQMVVKRQAGAFQIYVRKDQQLWRCVNPIGGTLKQYPKAVWDDIHNFLVSSAGRSVIMASKCRFEAATFLKNSCLKDLTLGDVLQILNTVITIKKWIIPHSTGWQPIFLNLA